MSNLVIGQVEKREKRATDHLICGEEEALV
jgi:hypothetical protein